MSDMSLPPLSLVPLPHEGSGPPALPPLGSAPPGATAFTWPLPAVGGYPAAAPLAAPEPCEIEGLNGKLSSGRLMVFDADAGLVSLNIPPARGLLTLKP